MLVYIREIDKEKIICNVDEKDIAEHLRVRGIDNISVDLEFYLFYFYFVLLVNHAVLMCPLNTIFQIRLKKEQEEKEQKRKEKAEAHLYTIIKVKNFTTPCRFFSVPWFFLFEICKL